MILLGDEYQVEACLSPFRDSGSVDMRKVRGLCLIVPSAGKLCWTHPMELLGEWVMWNLVSVHFEIVLVSVQYRSTVCTERTIGPEIVLDAHDDSPR
jgi:hypothetical protein